MSAYPPAALLRTLLADFDERRRDDPRAPTMCKVWLDEPWADDLRRLAATIEHITPEMVQTVSIAAELLDQSGRHGTIPDVLEDVAGLLAALRGAA